jgi:hypothetical protein
MAHRWGLFTQAHIVSTVSSLSSQKSRFSMATNGDENKIKVGSGFGEM